MPDAMYTLTGKQALNVEAAQSRPRRGAGIWAFLCLAAAMAAITLTGLLARRGKKGGAHG